MDFTIGMTQEERFTELKKELVEALQEYLTEYQRQVQVLMDRYHATLTTRLAEVQTEINKLKQNGAQ